MIKITTMSYERGPKGFLPKWLQGTLDLVLRDPEYARELEHILQDPKRSCQLSADDTGGIETALDWKRKKSLFQRKFRLTDPSDIADPSQN